jgi:hypothetical protein
MKVVLVGCATLLALSTVFWAGVAGLGFRARRELRRMRPDRRSRCSFR